MAVNSDVAPPIEPLPQGVVRPRISVMIPTYNNLQFLAQALESVLRENIGPEQMQIEVVDDCSATTDAESITYAIGKGRVAFYRQPENMGLARNFNSCIARARGEWVHILHNDDYVSEGFYKEAINIIDQQNPSAIAFRCFLVDSNNDIVLVTDNYSTPDGPARVRTAFLTGTPVQCSGVLVRRSVYESIGGFRPAFSFLVDVDMWSRVFCSSETVFSPKCLACFRLHPGSAGVHLVAQGQCADDYYRMIPHLRNCYHFSTEEMAIFRRECHLKAHFYCMGVARKREAGIWFQSQWNYLRQIRTLDESLRYLVRLTKNGHAWISPS